jgi:hypothetical protein
VSEKRETHTTEKLEVGAGDREGNGVRNGGAENLWRVEEDKNPYAVPYFCVSSFALISQSKRLVTLGVDEQQAAATLKHTVAK